MNAMRIEASFATGYARRVQTHCVSNSSAKPWGDENPDSDLIKAISFLFQNRCGVGSTLTARSFLRWCDDISGANGPRTTLGPWKGVELMFSGRFDSWRISFCFHKRLVLIATCHILGLPQFRHPINHDVNLPLIHWACLDYLRQRTVVFKKPNYLDAFPLTANPVLTAAVNLGPLSFPGKVW